MHPPRLGQPYRLGSNSHINSISRRANRAGVNRELLMSKWITAADGCLVNLDHVLTIEIMKSGLDTFQIVADLGTKNEYLLTSDNKKGVDLAFKYLEITNA